MKKDITTMMAAADRLIEQSTNTRHIAILKNYRRHAMLEVSGRFDEIFDPSMTIENPRYVSYLPDGNRLIMNGQEEVRAHFYHQFITYGASVMLLEDEHLAVADWGFGSEYISNDYINAEVARLRGFEVDDEDAMYLHRHGVVMTWRYDDDCRLIGEHVSMEPKGTLEKLAPEDVITVAEAKEKLAPLIGDPPPRLNKLGLPVEAVTA